MSNTILANRPVEVFYDGDNKVDYVRAIVRRSVHRVKNLDSGGQVGRARIDGEWHKVRRPLGSRVWQLDE
jgi:hypothetical protein